MTNQNFTIEAENLSRTFSSAVGEVRVVNDISLKVKAGTMTALVGPDGAGKTTFMRMVAGLLKPDSGQLMVLGSDVAVQPQIVQDRISYMPQRFGLYEDLSVQENLDLYADLHGVPQSVRSERFARLLEITDLARFKTRPAGKLSGGMKQKLGLSCTLVRSPDLLLLDEPSVGVDPLSRRDLWQIVQQLVADEQLTVLISTAYMDEAERCEHVFIMNHGQLLAEGTPGQLSLKSHGLTYVAKPSQNAIARNLQATLIDAVDDIVDAVPSGGTVRFIRQSKTTDERLNSLIGAGQWQARPEELEDTFMLLLRQSQQQHLHSPTKSIAPAIHASQSDSDQPVIVVKDLLRQFGDFVAVDRTSFDVHRGEIFGLLGPNGAGKTTTFRMLCGLLPATSGHLEVAGVNLRNARAQARQRIGYVSQKFALYGNLTVHENLTFFGGAYGLRGRALRHRIAAVVDQFDLVPSARSGDLSAGYKQRLAMAAGLIHEPEILFLDEPTSGIDPLARRSFWRTITALTHTGVTVVITTHFMEEAEYCDRIAIQDSGKLLALGSPSEVRLLAKGPATQDMNSAFISIVERSRRESEATKLKRMAS